MRLDSELTPAERIALSREGMSAQRWEQSSREIFSDKWYLESREIVAIEGPRGNLTSDPGEMIGVIRKYYSDLYTLGLVDEGVLGDALNLLVLRLGDDQKNSLEGDISVAEIEQCIREMPRGKAQGLNGFTVDLFKICTKGISIAVLGRG